MEMTQLRTFRAVAEALNFTRAAERLHLTQSAVSHQIKALEEELGEPLFIRAKRGVKLSQAGKIALEYVGRILDDTEALRESVSGREGSGQLGPVPVSVVGTRARRCEAHRRQKGSGQGHRWSSLFPRR